MSNHDLRHRALRFSRRRARFSRIASEVAREYRVSVSAIHMIIRTQRAL